MNSHPLQRPFNWPLAALAALLVATWLTMLLGGTRHVDQAVYQALYAGHRPTLLAAARVLTAIGEPTTLIGACVICALWLWRGGRGRLGLSLLAVALIGRGLSEIQKIWIDRPRPSLEPHLVMVRTPSFPSGHATSSMVFYLALAIALAGHSRWRLPAIGGAVCLSLLIGLSRVMLGVHWPSDVVAGWATGALWVLVALRPTERMLRAS